MSVRRLPGVWRAGLAALAALVLLAAGLPSAALAAESDQISGEVILPQGYVVDAGSGEHLVLTLWAFRPGDEYGGDSYWYQFDQRFIFESSIEDNKAAFSFSGLPAAEAGYLLGIDSGGGGDLVAGYYVANDHALTLTRDGATSVHLPAVGLELRPALGVAITGTVTLPITVGAYHPDGVQVHASHVGAHSYGVPGSLTPTGVPGDYAFSVRGLAAGEPYVVSIYDEENWHRTGYYRQHAAQTTAMRGDALPVSAPSDSVHFVARDAKEYTGTVQLPPGADPSSVQVEARSKVGTGEEAYWGTVGSSSVSQDDHGFSIAGLAGGAYAIYVSDSRGQIRPGYWNGNGSALSAQPTMAPAAGNEGIVLSPEATPSIYGHVALGPDAHLDDFEIVALEHDAVDGWTEVRSTGLFATGSYYLSELEGGEDYVLRLDSQDDDVVGGYYAGPGAALTGVPDAASLVTAATAAVAAGIALAPGSSAQISGSIELPTDFRWAVDEVANRVEVDAVEVLPDGRPGRTGKAQLELASGGEFTVRGLPSGTPHVLKVTDLLGEFEAGFHHHGVAGLVAELSGATPVVSGAAGVVIVVAPNVVEPQLASVVAPSVSGEATVGKVLSVSAGTWSMFGVDVSFQWLRDGEPITGETGPTYEAAVADMGKQLSVLVVAVKPGHGVVSEETVPTSPVAAATMASTGLPVITGSIEVGEVLSATAGSWDQPGVTSAFQWLRDGAVIAGATQARYALTAGDAGARIAARVTVRKPGFSDATATSAPTASVAKGKAPRASKAPTFTGALRFGSTLTASPGSWDLAGASYSFQWLRAGKVITGATSATYKVKAYDVGERLSLRVMARVPGYEVGVATSKSSTKIAKVKAKVTAKAKAVKVGKRASVTVRVRAAGVARPSGTVTVRYGKKVVKVKLKAKAKGKVSVRLPKLKKGKYTIRATFTPDTKTKTVVRKATSKKVTLRVR